MVFEAMLGPRDPDHADRLGQCQPCDQLLCSVAVVLSLNDEHGRADVRSCSFFTTAALGLLPFEFAAHAFGDAQFCTAPHAIDLSGEMGCQCG